VGHQGDAWVENISFGGVRLSLDGGVPAEADEALRLSLVAPSLWDPLVLRGRVVWIEPSPDKPAVTAPRHLGVAFVHESPRAVLALHDLISTLAYE
jgi:hypothetical protein